MTAHLPRKWRKEFCYVDVGGRTKLAIGGVISDYIPNPTFEVLAAPGTHEKWYRNANTEGLTLRELSGKPIPCPPAYRNGADRLALMDEQGIHASLLFPTLASAVEERMSYDHALMNAVLHSLNEWLHAAVGLPSRGADLRRPVPHADGRGHGGGGARVAARTRRAHGGTPSRAGAGLPRQPLAGAARVRPVLGARAGGGHLRLASTPRTRATTATCGCGRAAGASSSASCTRR